MADVKSKRISQAMVFIIMFGIVSMFSDMTHEGAASIRGAFLSLIGASAATIGFVSGLGEFIGYSLRYIFGKIADVTKKYWSITILGYVVDIMAVPALALVAEDGWIMACMLLIIQRMGKAIKKPAKDTVMSFAAKQEGVGKSFGIQEVLDQFGAFIGPVLLYLVMLFRTAGSEYELYTTCFAFLAIPGAITIILLILTWRKFPNPEKFEPEPKEYIPFKIGKKFILYIAGISIFAFGFIDYALILMHVANNFMVNGDALNSTTVPLLYAAAMLIDALSALFFGVLFDKKGTWALVLSTLISAPFAILVFMSDSMWMVVAGVLLWGVGMGAQESILKATVANMVPKQSRATGYGIFELSFGVFWFLGSWTMGALYEVDITVMIIVSVVAQLAAIPLYISSVVASSDAQKA